MTISHALIQSITGFLKAAFTIAFGSFLLNNISAQTSVQVMEADQLFQQKAIIHATEKYQTPDSNDLHALEQLAHSYRLNHDTKNAERYYAQVVNRSYDPLNYLYYAQALQSNGKTAEAKEYFLKYDKLMAVVGDRRGREMAAAIEYIAAPTNEGIAVENLKSLNSAHLDYSPAFYQNGIVFASTRNDENEVAQNDKWTGTNYSSLYFAENQANNTFSNPTEFSTGLTTKFHEGPLAFSKSGELLFYTRNISPKKNNSQKEVYLKIATAIKLGKRWLKDDLLDLGWSNCNDVHPTLSHDGQMLFFASDRPGGYGGMDIYVTYFSNDHWSTPINLGSSVNTAGNEIFPFIHESGALYFASDGWGGFGGLDIFYSMETVDGDWEDATNIGQPFNSAKDDFGYIIDVNGKSGYFSSAREGGMGKDDLYRFVSDEPFSMKIEKWKRNDMLITNDKITPIKAEEYKPEPKTNTSKIATSATPFLKELESISKSGDFLQLEKIYYDYGQSTIRSDAAQELDLLAQFLNDHPKLSIELRSHTDSRGEAHYNIDLSESRARAAASYLMEKGVAAWRIKAIGMGEKFLLNNCNDGVECSEEEHQKNRRTEVRFVKER